MPDDTETPFVLSPVDLKPRPGIDFDKISNLLDLDSLDGAGRRHEPSLQSPDRPVPGGASDPP